MFGGQRVLVVGGGVTGSAVARSLKTLGAHCEIVDEKQVEGLNLLEQEDALNQIWDFAVISPGWRQDHVFIEMLRTRGVRMMSEIDLAWMIKTQIIPNQRWLGITGTNGKTTTVEMVAAMLQRDGKKVKACGNLGDAVVEAVLAPEAFDFLVLELSSFQLQWSELPHFIAVAILNIADDHLDWHGSFQNYVNAKLRILENASLAILNADDGVVVLATQKWSGEKVFFTLGSPSAGEIGVVEDLLVDRAFVDDAEEADVIAELHEIIPIATHSVLNTLAAAALALSVGALHENVRAAIQDFRPGRHRIELVLDAEGIRWINDSKATNPHAALASLMSFESVIWIAGGLAKGANMDELVLRGKSKIKRALLIGQDRELIAQALARNAPEIPVNFIDVPDGKEISLMEQIIITAQQEASAGDVVLLAPACASMDQFVSYSDRGDQFCQATLKIAGKG